MLRTIVRTVAIISPATLILVLVETGSRGAYPTDGDSYGIPVFGYLLVFYPITLYLVAEMKAQPWIGLLRFLWNPRRKWFSTITLVVSIYPLGLFWVAFALVSIEVGAVASGIWSVLTLLCVWLARGFAIQSKPDKPASNPDS